MAEKKDGVKKNRNDTYDDFPASHSYVSASRAEKRVSRKKTYQQEESDGTVSRLLQHDLAVFNWGDVPMQNPEAVAQRCVKYLDFCVEDDVKPTIAGLALALGIDRLTLLRYKEGVLGKNPDVRNVIKRTCNFINSQMETWFASGKINPVAAIFLMKNNFAYRDQTEVIVANANPMGPEPDQKALEEKYLNSIVLNEDEIEKHMD